MLGIEKYMGQLTAGTRLRQFENAIGHELGVVRVSLGLASNFNDVKCFLKFARFVADEESREKEFREWSQTADAGDLVGHF